MVMGKSKKVVEAVFLSRKLDEEARIDKKDALLHLEWLLKMKEDEEADEVEDDD